MSANEDSTWEGNCPDRDLLLAYILGKLSGAALESLAAHVGLCPRCEALLNGLHPEEDVLVHNLRRFVPLGPSAQGTGDDLLSTTAVARPLRILPPRTLSLPCRLGSYELLKELGRGGMGVVYLARQLDLDRLVALKVAFGGLDNGEHLARFRTESQVIARLRHENIIHVYACGEQDGLPFFSMEYVEGGSLAQKLAGKPMPEREAALLVRTLARAVHYAHQHGVVHRDIKPGNILLESNGEVKLSDLGLARLLDGEGMQTQTGMILGTASYMAPEQAQGEARTAGPLADVYGLGAVLYQTLTGQPPFRGKTRTETLEQVRTRPPLPPSRLRRRLSPGLEAICLKCLEKIPEQRYASAEDLAEDLDRWLHDQPTIARPQGWLKRVLRPLRQNPVRSWLAALVGMVVLSTALVTALNQPAFQLWQIERDLAQGKPVVLIGETGGPRWHRERVPHDPRESPTHPADHFAVHSWGLALVELVPDPGQDAYRFRAEIRHDANQAEGEVGLYVAHAQPESRLPTLHQFVAVQFTGIRWRPRNPKPVTLLPRALLLEPPNAVQEQISFLGREGPACVPDGPGHNNWRKVVVEVTPKEIRVFWGEERTPLAPLSFEEIAASVEKKLADIQATTPDAPLRKAVRSRFSPRGGLGLYVFRGAALFRSVVLEPL